MFWVNADTHEALITDFAAMATPLQLPEQHEQDQRRIVMAVKRWLETHQGWLLILDNADEIFAVAPFLPAQGAGHVLLTTRAHALGMLAQSVEIEQMEPEEGVLFLLRRAKHITSITPLDAISASVRAQATDIVAEVGGLPLALDQAGAYIEETSCSLSEYLHLYRTHRAELLKARGAWPTYHPEPVATTWAMALEKVQQTNPAAVDLLNLCAFLAPDDIPEELFLSDASKQKTTQPSLIKDRHALNIALKVLLTFSLLRRHSETHTLTIHRLVQAVIKDAMSEQTQQYWAEHAVRAVNRHFPYAADVQAREQCQRYLLHALACAAYIEQWKMRFPEAVRLLRRTGSYLCERAQYREAEPLYQQALAIYERVYGEKHSLTADSLIYLANLYSDQGKYEPAELLYERALAIYEPLLGAERPDTAMTLNNLANLYSDQSKYEPAELLYQRALAIRERMRGAEHPDTVRTLENYVVLLEKTERQAEAAKLKERIKAIRAKKEKSVHAHRTRTKADH